jgi:hypothetical protein
MPDQATDDEIVIDWSQPHESIEWDLAAGWRLLLSCSVQEARDRVIRDHLHYGELRPVGHFMRRYDHIPSVDISNCLLRMGLEWLDARSGRPQRYSDEEVPYTLGIKDWLRGKGRPSKKDRDAPDALMVKFCQDFAKGYWGKPENRPVIANLFDPTPNTCMHFVTVSRRTRGKAPDTPFERLRDLTIYHAVKAFQAANDQREIAIARVAHMLRGGQPDDDIIKLRLEKGVAAFDRLGDQIAMGIPGESTVNTIVKKIDAARRKVK